MTKDVRKSPFFSCPEKFLNVGQRVRAIVRVYDLPGNLDPGPVHAEKSEFGTVVHVEPGYWPTVTFDRTGTSTCVTDLDVEPTNDRMGSVESKSVRILDFIAKRDGTSFTDIQRELCRMSGLDYDRASLVQELGGDGLWRTRAKNRLRGYWCTNLLGGSHYHAGLLNFYCTKGKDGLWRRNRKKHYGSPWTRLNTGRPRPRVHTA